MYLVTDKLESSLQQLISSGRGPVLGGPLCDILVLDVRSVDMYQDVH